MLRKPLLVRTSWHAVLPKLGIMQNPIGMLQLLKCALAAGSLQLACPRG